MNKDLFKLLDTTEKALTRINAAWAIGGALKVRDKSSEDDDRPSMSVRPAMERSSFHSRVAPTPENLASMFDWREQPPFARAVIQSSILEAKC